MLKSVELNLADRQLVSRLVAGADKVDLAVARSIRDIRRRFELKEAQRLADRLNNDKEIDKLEVICDELYHEHIDTREDLNEMQKGWFKQQLDPWKLAAVTWDDLMETGGNTFTIDDTYLVYLRDQLETFNWSEVRTQEGQLVSIPVPPVLAEAIADLGDSLAGAKDPKTKKSE